MHVITAKSELPMITAKSELPMMTSKSELPMITAKSELLRNNKIYKNEIAFLKRNNSQKIRKEQDEQD